MIANIALRGLQWSRTKSSPIKASNDCAVATTSMLVIVLATCGGPNAMERPHSTTPNEGPQMYASGKVESAVGMHGIAIESIEDIDSDGVPEICVGDPGFTGQFVRQGRVLIYSGKEGECIGEVRGDVANQGFGRELVRVRADKQNPSEDILLVGSIGSLWSSEWNLSSIRVRSLEVHQMCRADRPTVRRSLIVAGDSFADKGGADYLIISPDGLTLGGEGQIALFDNLYGNPVWSRSVVGLCGQVATCVRGGAQMGSCNPYFLLGCADSNQAFAVSAVDGHTMRMYSFDCHDNAVLAALAWIPSKLGGHGVVVAGFPDYIEDNSQCDIIAIDALTGDKVYSVRETCKAVQTNALCGLVLKLLDSCGGKCGEVVVACDDADGDGVRDVCIGASENAAVICVSGSTGLPLWVTQDELATRRGGCVAIGNDCDNDAILDILVGGVVGIGLIPPQDISILSGVSGKFIRCLRAECGHP